MLTLWYELLLSDSETQLEALEPWGITPAAACLSLYDAQVTAYRPVMIKDPPKTLLSWIKGYEKKHFKG